MTEDIHSPGILEALAQHMADDLDREILEDLFPAGQEFTLTPILSKSKPEPFYGWSAIKITVDRYNHEEGIIFDTEDRSFQINKYKIK